MKYFWWSPDFGGDWGFFVLDLRGVQINTPGSEVIMPIDWTSFGQISPSFWLGCWNRDDDLHEKISIITQCFEDFRENLGWVLATFGSSQDFQAEMCWRGSGLRMALINGIECDSNMATMVSLSTELQCTLRPNKNATACCVNSSIYNMTSSWRPKWPQLSAIFRSVKYSNSAK